MTKEEKFELVETLTEKFKGYPNFYIADTGGMSVSEINQFRGLCHEAEIPMQMVKNTLIQKALEKLEGDYSGVFPYLKQTSSVMFATEENPNTPAKILKKYRKASDKPLLKVACIDTAVFAGDNQIDTLANMKSKAELVGEIVGLLQSPAKQVLSALQSGGATIAGLVKTLSEREEA